MEKILNFLGLLLIAASLIFCALCGRYEFVSSDQAFPVRFDKFKGELQTKKVRGVNGQLNWADAYWTIEEGKIISNS